MDAGSPRVPQLHFGTPWIMMCRCSAGTPISSNVLGIVLLAKVFGINLIIVVARNPRILITLGRVPQ